MLHLRELKFGDEVNWESVNFFRLHEEIVTDYHNHIQVRSKNRLLNRFHTFIFRDNQWIYVGLCYKDQTVNQKKVVER